MITRKIYKHEFGPKYTVFEQLYYDKPSTAGYKMGTCVLKASTVNCRSIPSINILDPHPINTSVDT